MPRIRMMFLVAVVLLVSGSVQADVKPHALFSDGMVLQRGVRACPVWGTADPGENVTVKLNARGGTTEAKATADEKGQWTVLLRDLEAGGPCTLTISGKNTVTIKDVQVGEVWICSGQSNMEMSMAALRTPEGAKDIKNAGNHKIRLFKVPRRTADTPQTKVAARWQECSPETVRGFSAVGYYFGRHLQKALDVPVGLIESAWGGTVAEAWTPRSYLEARPDLKGLLGRGKPPNRATVLYNGMIAPLQPYAIKGAIWYQGESNASRAYQYKTLFPTMIEGWRGTWNQGDFPFLFVQLAPWQKIVTEPTQSAWAELREAQRLTALNVKNTGMAVITDVGNEKDIHPRKKEPVGTRLALAARAIAYGEKITYSGPMYERMEVEGNRAVLHFQHVGKGLEARGGKLTGFTIAGPDHQFHNATAEIRDDTVVVHSDEVDKPTAVRFGWANYPVVNLWNKDGLPASPFRTDDFPWQTGPKSKN
jgi:sialate O-acetylesterase